MQVYFILQIELLQTGTLELDTLFPFLSTFDDIVVAMILVRRCNFRMLDMNLSSLGQLVLTIPYLM